jgi:hypothetical protein
MVYRFFFFFFFFLFLGICCLSSTPLVPVFLTIGAGQALPMLPPPSVPAAAGMYLPYPNPIAACGAPPALAVLPSLSAGYPRGFHHTGAGSVVGQCFPSFAQAPGVPIMGATQNQFFPTTMRGVFPPAIDR